MEHILFDLDGQKLAAHFDKNGFLYILDRTTMDAGPGGAVRRPHRLGRGRREGQRDAEGLPRQGGRPGALLARPGRRQGVDARVLQPEDGAPLRARCRTSARRPRGGAGSSRRASRTGAPASPWTARTRPATSAPTTRAPARSAGAGRNDIPHVLVAAGHGRRPRVRRGADRGVQRARRQQRRAAVAVPVRQRPPQQPVDATASTGSSTSSRRPAGAAGPRGSCPRCSGPPTEARCSRSRCRSNRQMTVTNYGLRLR